MKFFFALLLSLISSNLFAQDALEIITLVQKGQYSASDLSQWSQEKSDDHVCQELEELSLDKLVYFETVFSSLGCAQKLEEKLVPYQQQLNQSLFLAYQQKSAKLLELRPAPPVNDNPNLGLIDTNQAPVLVKADLPAGFVALTFDDGPHPTITRNLFETLERSSIQATFFPTGLNAQRFPGLIDDYARYGHTYGSHTMTHPDLRRVSFQEAKGQILDALNLLTSMTGQEMRFFRFPYGATNPQLNRFLKEKKIASFFWNIDSEDWRHRDPVKAYNQVVEQLNSKRSGIILFHDIVSATSATVEILVQELENKGYQVVLLRPKI